MKHYYIKLMLPVLLCIVSLSTSAHNFEVGGICEDWRKGHKSGDEVNETN